MTDHPIAHLLARVALNDRAAFAQLYSETSAKLFAICLRILKDKRDAEDALQEIYIRVWHRAAGFDATAGSPLGWLNAVARNHAIDRLRARKPGSLPDGMDIAEAIADSGPTPEEAAMTASDGRRIDGCLSELDLDRADAIRRAYVEGESYLELAERFSVPLNTMRSWLRRSLLSLRECLSR